MRKNYFLIVLAMVFTVNAMAQNIPSFMPKDGLVGYWPFNGNANDESGNNNNGTVNGATLTADRNGNLGKAYSFDGKNNYISVENKILSFDFGDNQNFSVTLWVKTSYSCSSSNYCGGILSKMGYTIDEGIGYQIGYNSSNKWNLEYNTNATVQNTTAYYNGVITDNKWHMLTSSIDKKNNKIYFYTDGVLTNTVSQTWFYKKTTNQNPLYFGRLRGADYYYNGNIDDIAIFNRTLTQQEITNLYKSANSKPSICQTIGSDSLSLYKKGYITGPQNVGSQPIHTDTKWIKTTGVDTLYLHTMQHRLYDNSKIYNQSNNLIWTWGGESVPATTWYPRKHKLFVGGNDSVRLEFYQGYTNFNVGHLQVVGLYCSPTLNTLSSTKVYVDAPATVKQNDTLELSISTEALNTVDNVIAYQTDFTYDTTRYAYIGNNLVGTLNSAGSVDINTSKKGLLKLGYMTQTALNGAGSLVKLKFKANNTLGQGIFGLSNFLYNTTAITSLKNDTVTTLDAIPPSAKLSYSQNPVRKGDSLLITVKYSEKMAIAPVPQLNLTGQNTLANANLTKVNDTTYTYWWVVEKGNGLVNVTLASGKDLAGNNIVASPTQNASFTVLPTIFGDIDTNKFVQAYDGALALQYSVGLNPLPTMDPLPWSNWRIAVANVDTVGNITANDASLILQKSIDKIASFPADAKKRGDAPVANITVTQEANQLVFRATGTLYAFNVFMKDNFNAFGQPEVNDKNAMIATNITSTTYNVGLASTTPFTENEPFLVIPILTNDNLQGTMDIVANAQEKALAYGTAASIATIQNDAMVVYPNPTKDLVTIKNAQGKTLRIVDFQGRLVNTQIVTSNAHDVSLKAIATKGEYIFQLIGENNETIATQKVVMQ